MTLMTYYCPPRFLLVLRVRTLNGAWLMGKRAQMTRESNAGYAWQPSCVYVFSVKYILAFSLLAEALSGLFFQEGYSLWSNICIVSSSGDVGGRKTFHSCSTAALMSKMNKINQLGRTLGCYNLNKPQQIKPFGAAKRTRRGNKNQNKDGKKNAACILKCHLGACSAADLVLTFYT